MQRVYSRAWTYMMMRIVNSVEHMENSDKSFVHLASFHLRSISAQCLKMDRNISCCPAFCSSEMAFIAWAWPSTTRKNPIVLLKFKIRKVAHHT